EDRDTRHNYFERDSKNNKMPTSEYKPSDDNPNRRVFTNQFDVYPVKPNDEPDLDNPPREPEKDDDPDKPESYAKELANQLEILDNLCDDYFHGDPQTVLDPFLPGIMNQIENQLELLNNDDEWQNKYPDIVNMSALNERCDAGHFQKRGRELIQSIRNFPWSAKKKFEALKNFYNAKTFRKDIYEEPETSKIYGELRAASTPWHGRGESRAASWQDSDETKNQRQLAEQKEFYNEVYQKLIDTKSDLPPEEKRHLAKYLNQAYNNEHKLVMLDDDDFDKYKNLIREYVIIPDLIEEYQMFIEKIENPPKDPEEAKHYESSLRNLLGGILKSMREFGIYDPAEIGADYTLEELQIMNNDLKPENI
ncbi:MAG: hypothetical protein AAB390_04590, partial [Patescibacteria group bacterium]